jgi:hypothetical protein
MTGSRLLVEVEGQTEEEFVKIILRPHLLGRGYERVDARILGNARSRDRRGGITNWPSASRDILGHLKQDPGRIVTTMVDYYALPASEDEGWPGRRQAASLMGTSKRAEAVEEALRADISSRMNKGFDPTRFVPFVAMYEYEGLLFSDCPILAEVLEQPSLATQLSTIRAGFSTPEDINDSRKTAPSKRIQALMESVGQRYDKPYHGVLAFETITLSRVRSECPHFDRWLCRLEDRAMARP